MCSLNLESCHAPLTQNNSADTSRFLHNKPTYGEVVDLKKQTPNSKKSTWAEIRLLNNDEASRAAAWASTMEVKGLLKGLETSMTFLMSQERRRRAQQIGWQLCTQVLIQRVSNSHRSCQFIHCRLRAIFEWASRYQEWFSFQDYSIFDNSSCRRLLCFGDEATTCLFWNYDMQQTFAYTLQVSERPLCKVTFSQAKRHSRGRVCEMCPPKRFWLCTLRDVLGTFSSKLIYQGHLILKKLKW